MEFPGSTLDCNTPLRYTHFVVILSDSALDISPSSSSYTSLLYKGLKGKARIPTDDLIPKIRRGRNQHSLAFQIPSASKDVYMFSFFPQTIRDWNDLPESLISSSELSDDGVSKFTSLVRARDLFPPVTAFLFFLLLLSRSNFDHHLRCGWWLNFEFS